MPLAAFLGMTMGHEASLTDRTKTPSHAREFGLDIRARLGRRVRQLRRQRKWTQCGMAQHFGLDRAFLSDVERGRKSVSLRTLEVIALGMKITISDLLQDL